MKLILSIIIVATFYVGFTSCNNTKTKQDQEAVELTDSAVTTDKMADIYQCPMKCEGDKTYAEPGQCPECGMDIKKKE